MDAEKIVERLRGFKGRINQFESDDVVMEAAAAFIEAQTRPLTLEECRDALNENEYSFKGAWAELSPWLVETCEQPYRGDGEPLLYDGSDRLTLFEATCLARGFMAQGGAK